MYDNSRGKAGGVAMPVEGGSAKVSCGRVLCVCAESSKLLVRMPLTKDTDCC